MKDNAASFSRNWLLSQIFQGLPKMLLTLSVYPSFHISICICVWVYTYTYIFYRNRNVCIYIHTYITFSIEIHLLLDTYTDWFTIFSRVNDVMSTDCSCPFNILTSVPLDISLLAWPYRSSSLDHCKTSVSFLIVAVLIYTPANNSWVWFSLYICQHCHFSYNFKIYALR